MAKSVLIVEDDQNIADLLRLYLEKDGFEAPKFSIDESITDFYAFTKDSFQMEGYRYHDFNFEIPMAI
jgi:thymidylate synthase